MNKQLRPHETMDCTYPAAPYFNEATCNHSFEILAGMNNYGLQAKYVWVLIRALVFVNVS